MVNVNDIDDDKIPEATNQSEAMMQIFVRQHELMLRYHTIEKQNGFSSWMPQTISLDLAGHQLKLKEMAWRVTEELAEAMEANIEGNQTHFYEEVADAYHFLVELNLLSGVSPADIMREIGNYPTEIIHDDCWATVYYLGLAMNCLKNKPWKTTQMMTDKNKYRSLVIMSNLSFLRWLSKYIDYSELHAIYFKKSEVNKFRQGSNY